MPDKTGHSVFSSMSIDHSFPLFLFGFIMIFLMLVGSYVIPPIGNKFFPKYKNLWGEGELSGDEDLKPYLEALDKHDLEWWYKEEEHIRELVRWFV